ncbi:MAG TPA: S8 family serine peptidase [Gaiellaceae bacterium]|nr:S8 family serine peptidase [Gaiellaceae bacterium]
MIRLAAAAFVAALLPAAPAQAARFAVGVDPGASVAQVSAAVERATRAPADRSLQKLGALVVETRSARTLRGIAGVAYVERLDASRRLAFTPTDPLAAKQWHLEQDRATTFWPEFPALSGPKVAVIDSGIDGTHPEFAGRIAGARSFVGGNPLADQQGHGTFVAGLIAAQTNNGVGIAGMAFGSQLLIAKVVRPSRQVSLEAEADAIRWAVDNGARVINLSLGGLRDPRDPSRDTYSPLEAAAVRYAYTRGVVVVAAVGNGDQAPTTPWPYASYPAALPHVIGVGALSKDGAVPAFSNRDPIYNDLTAPGEELVSTFPRQLTAQRPACDEQGYSICGPDEYRTAEGTSFSAPQVTAAAALLLSLRPLLRPDQVAHVLTRSASDLTASTGCKQCPPLRDSYSGWGRLDVERALASLAGPMPSGDRFESNDDAGAQATPLRRRRADFTATLDFWDDHVDVYKLFLRKGQRITITLESPRRSDADLVLWKPGTQRVEGLSLALLRKRAAMSATRNAKERIRYRAKAPGWYYIEAKLVQPGDGAYRLAFVKR